jgi:pSer/pThr/pTyr-binding forkhead associated (FHA) protein
MPHIKLLDRTISQTYRVDAADVVLGRDPNANIVLKGEAAAVVSTRHAHFFVDQGQWCVEDLGSRNGTFINGRRLDGGARERLSVGDEVGFGATGPKLRVEEIVGRSLATTMGEGTAAIPGSTLLESRPTVPSGVPIQKAPVKSGAEAVPRKTPADGNPSAPGRQMVRLSLKSGDGKRLAGQDMDVVIGRSREATIRLDGDMALAVSRRHARIFYSGWKICIEDLGSRNGTWLNRKRVESPTIIDKGDVIEFGAGGPMLTVTDVALLAPDAPRKTEVEMKPVDVEVPFVSEIPTPPMDRPAVKAGGEKKA